MNNFSYFSAVRTIFNNDLAEGLSEVREVLGVDKAMIVTDPGVAALPIWGEMQAAMDSIGFACEPITKGKPNPTDVTMTEAANALNASDCDVVIGFGGGSAIDTAKAAALLVCKSGRALRLLRQEDNLLTPQAQASPPLFAATDKSIPFHALSSA